MNKILSLYFPLGNIYKNCFLAMISANEQNYNKFQLLPRPKHRVPQKSKFEIYFPKSVNQQLTFFILLRLKLENMTTPNKNLEIRENYLKARQQILEILAGEGFQPIYKYLENRGGTEIPFGFENQDLCYKFVGSRLHQIIQNGTLEDLKELNSDHENLLELLREIIPNIAEKKMEDNFPETRLEMVA